MSPYERIRAAHDKLVGEFISVHLWEIWQIKNLQGLLDLAGFEIPPIVGMTK